MKDKFEIYQLHTSQEEELTRIRKESGLEGRKNSMEFDMRLPWGGVTYYPKNVEEEND